VSKKEVSSDKMTVVAHTGVAVN